MKLNVLFTINTVIAGFFGILLVLVAGKFLSLYGITMNPGSLLVANLFGAALIGFALICWCARNAEESEALKAIILAFFIADGVGFIMALIGQLSGAVNALGWSTVAIYLFLTLGYGYLWYKGCYIQIDMPYGFCHIFIIIRL